MLTPAELGELESTLLPALERHHLRLLAHALRTLQAIASRRDGPAPDPASIDAWLLGQPQLASDGAFASAFAAQLGSAARQLEAIATPSRQALDLDLDDLIGWATRRADDRIGRATGSGGHP